MFQLPSPVQKINYSIAIEKNIALFIKRDDLIHPEISGNKWRKLKYNIAQYKLLKKDSILTFGGPFSNHIAAVASVCAIEKINCIGIIRGEDADLNNPTLSFAVEKGMTIIPVSREEYTNKKEAWYHDELRQRFGDILIIPEGGANYYGVNGCIEILTESSESKEPDYVCVAAGTGTTAAGLLISLEEHQQLMVFPALKGDFIYNEIESLVRNSLFEESWIKECMKKLIIIPDYHFGGYAKYNSSLIEFMHSFEKKTGIETDFIYTAKMFYGITDLITKNYFPENTGILAIHTGGLQGNKGLRIREV